MDPIIFISDYLPPRTPDEAADHRRSAIRFRRECILTGVEAVVTAAIGVCMVISTAAMLCIM